MKAQVLFAMRLMLTIGENHPLYAKLVEAIKETTLDFQELADLVAAARPF